MFQYPPCPCLGSFTAVKPAPFWSHIWPNSWVAKKVGAWRRLKKRGVQSSAAASLARLPSSETSGCVQHEAALGNILKRCHLPALQLAPWGERGWTRLRAWQAHGGGAFVWEIAELVSANSAHPAVIFSWEAWREGRWVFRGTPVTAPGY